MRLAAKPDIKGIAPNRFQGKGMTFEIGNKKSRETITKMDIYK
jgi:hypothetical protein